MTNSKATDKHTLIKSLRALYRNSFDKSINDIQRTWDNIIYTCDKHEIDTNLITMCEVDFDSHLMNNQLSQLNQVNNQY